MTVYARERVTTLRVGPRDPQGGEVEDHQDWIWGHGFIPRVNERSRSGIMQALAPSDLFTENTALVSCAIVDARMTLEDNDLHQAFRDRGVSMIIDTQAWRYSDPRTWNSAWAKMSYAPQSPFKQRSTWVRDYTLSDLMAQRSMGSSCLLLPGWFSSLESVELAQSVARWTLESFEEFRRSGFLLPAIAWLPMKPGATEAALAAAEIYADSGIVRGIYAHWSTFMGLREPLDRLKRAAKLMLEVQELGIPVIAGYCGAVGLAMRAVGISAADCGPCEGQTFDLANSVRVALPRSAHSKSTGGPSIRMWIRELSQPLTTSQMEAIRRDRIAHAEVMCRRACHRFRRGRESMSVAVHHSTLSLCEEAQQQSALPPSMRVDAAQRYLTETKSRIELIDTALRAGEQKALLQDHLDVQLALLSEAGSLHGVAS